MPTCQIFFKCQTFPLFCRLLVFHLCLTTSFFPACPLPLSVEMERVRGSGVSNVTARESLSWVEGSVYRVNQSCTNPWLPLTFTGGPFPINLQGPPPLEAWLRPLPTTTTTKHANPCASQKRLSYITTRLRKGKRDWKSIPSQLVCLFLNYSLK